MAGLLMASEDCTRTVCARPESRRLGRYTLTSLLGQGGMGSVYAARDTLLDREVAIKVLSATVASAPEILQRFLHEARAAARLSHPNVVAIHDVDQEGETHFLVMELARGQSAEDALNQRGPLPWEEATSVLADACRGLVAAHAAGLIHRDIKPGNLMLVPGVGTKLADFGVAKVIDGEALAVTLPGSIVGTPAYMSPEQCRAETLDARSDLYSLGATYFSLLTNHLPYVAETAMQVMFAHCDGPVPNPREYRPDVPESCAAVVRRAMAKRREERYPEARAFLADLEAILRAAPPPAPVPPAPVPVAVAPPPTPAPELPAPAGEKALVATVLSSSVVAIGPARRRGRRVAVFLMVALAGGLLTGVLLSGLKGKGVPAAQDQGEANKGPAVPRLEAGRPGAGVLLAEKVPAPLAGKRVDAVAFSPDGRLLAAAGGDGDRNVQLWDMESGKTTRTRPLRSKAVRCLAFAPDGKALACGGEALEVWHLDGGADHVLAIPEGTSVSALTFAPDGKLAVGLDRGSSGPLSLLQVWDVPNEREVAAKGEHTGTITALAYGSGGRVLVSGSTDRTVRVWDPALEGKPRTLKVDMAVTGLAFPPEGSQLVVVGRHPEGKGLQFWDRKTWQRVDAWECSGTPHGAAFTRNGSLLAVANGPSLAVCDPRARQIPGATEAQAREILGLALAPDGLAATVGEDRTLRVWDLRPVAPVAPQ
jgi:hypothetical protein